MAKGKVYLIGAGPGRPDLITVRGLKILREAEVIIYDYLVDKQLPELAKEGTKLICCDRLGKQRHADGFLKDQERINQLIIKYAKQGKKVVRLRNGDAALFSRISEELDAFITHKIEFEIVPGVTAASAAAAYTGIPLTSRKFASSVIFATGHEDPQKKESLVDWEKVAGAGTIVLYMAVENIAKIADQLIKAGTAPHTPAAAVAHAARLDQKVVIAKLGNIAKEVKRSKITAPAIFIIGEVVKFEKEFNWLRKRKRVLFTGLAKERFFDENRTYFHLPLIEIKPLESYKQFDRQLARIRDFNWIVFSSRYGVKHFFERLNATSFDARVLKDIRIAVVGKSTEGQLLRFGVKADLVPKLESARGLLAAFEKSGLKNQRVFLPRSDLADKGLQKGLERLGAKVFSAVAYRNVMPKNLPAIAANSFDEIYFTSPSTVRNFKQRYGKVPPGVKIKWIGEVTKRELMKQRLTCNV